MTTHQPRRRLLTSAAASLILLTTVGLGAQPALARPDPGAPISTPAEGRCALARVGEQFVRCDLLTGNGVAAPAWVPER
jgi:hypothetical protein